MSISEPTETADSAFGLEGTVRKLSALLSRHIVPLFSEDGYRRPQPRGTGFLVSSASGSFLVSAAHVFDCSRSLFFYVGPKTQRWLSGEARLTKKPDGKSRESDRLDVGVLKLRSPGLPPYPQVDKYALPISDFMAGALPREGKVYLVLGFPGSKSQPHLVRRDVTSEPHAFFNTSPPMQKYTKIGVAPDSHIVIAFERTKALGPNGEVRTFPKPAGMSGSPVWLLYDEVGPNDPTRALVVGIFIEYKKSHHVMIAADISISLNMIYEAV
jgi:hypothetical protein